MIKIAPSLLAADFLNLENEIKKIQQAGADMLHLDVMDGHYVPNLSFGYPIIEKVKRAANIPLDVHLMVSNPEDYLLKLIEIGIEYVSFHPETVNHLHRQLMVLKENEIKAGVALNPATPIEFILPVLPLLDFVLIMSVNPGYGGQKFLPLVFDKIRKLRKLSLEKNPSLEIEVDGGVNNLNSRQLIDHGTDIIVAGTYVFGHDDYKTQIDSLKNLI